MKHLNGVKRRWEDICLILLVDKIWEELLAFLKLQWAIPQVTSMFIGLKFNINQVS